MDTAVHFPELAGTLMGIDRVTRKDRQRLPRRAQAMAEGLFDDHMATNPIMMGAAYQTGALPISAASIERAIRLNGVSVEMNLLAFRWGRMAVVDAKRVEAAVTQATGRVVDADRAAVRRGAGHRRSGRGDGRGCAASSRCACPS